MRGLLRDLAPVGAPIVPVTDDDLVRRVCAGATTAFALLAARYQRPVDTLAYRLLGNRADAEDAAQETFVRAYTRQGSDQPSARFGAWLLAITSHWCIDHLHRRRRTVSLERVWALAGRTPVASGWRWSRGRRGSAAWCCCPGAGWWSAVPLG